MTDERLRRAQREAAADPSTEARALLEATRAGTISLPRVRAAAHLGHAAARQVTGVARGATPSAALALSRWVRVLHDELGREGLVRLCLAAGAAVGRALAQARMSPARDYWPGLEVARAWALCPCDAHRESAYRVWRTAEEVAGRRPDHYDPPDLGEDALAVPRLTLRCVAGEGAQLAAVQAFGAARSLAHAAAVLGATRERGTVPRAEVSLALLLDDVEADLLAWLLGGPDPLATPLA